MDIVYPVKRQGRHNELRWSLRSLSCVDHGKVFLAGHIPHWAGNVVECKRDQRKHSKWQNSFLNYKLALLNSEISDQIMMMMDDVYFLKRVDMIPYMRGFKIGEIPWGKVSENYFKIAKKLKCRTSWSFEMHVPFVVEKEKILELFEIIERYAEGDWHDVHWRSLYGNYFRVPATSGFDVKTWDDLQIMDGQQFLSSSDSTFKNSVQPYLKELFPEPCLYER